MAWLTRLRTRLTRRRCGAALLAVPRGRVCGPDGRRRRVGPFRLDLRPVSNAEYLWFAQAMGRETPHWMFRPGFDDPDQPVVGVSYDDAAAFARWAGKRLPTAREWLRAARGDDARPYPWGSGHPESGHAHFGQGARGGPASIAGPAARNGGAGPFGHLDLVGNVWEWCADGALRGGFWGSTTLSLDDCLEPARERACAGYGFRCAV
jgi:formylglycine-generating enzyme required for sulfatase activity